MMKVLSVDLTPYYGLLQVSGTDAASFLQGQLSCDTQTAQNDVFLFGGHCNLKGRLRALFRIYQKNGIFYLQTPKTQLDFATSELKKYAKFSKVTLHFETDYPRIIGLMGVPDLEQFLTEYPLDPTIDVIKIPHTQTRYELIGPSAAISSFLNQLPPDSTIDFENWTLADIQDGLPEVWPELREQLLPHHINLPKLGGVSFTKGCYCGQEIIARMEYRGNVKKHMIRAKLSPATYILPGTELYLEDSDTEIGTVITAASVGDYTILLLEISNSHLMSNQTPSLMVKTKQATSPLVLDVY